MNTASSPGRERQSEKIITVRDVAMQFPVAKRYREWLVSPFSSRRVHTALTRVTLTVEAGDRIALMGPNGAGKTTLLKLIGGLLLPTEGEVLVNGFDTRRHSSAARKSVGFVFNEERSFFWRLTGRQNLEFFGALDNLTGKDLRDRINYLIDLLGLEKYVEKSVSTYSSGMKQRLAMARGLIADPDVLILDEPTRALDPVACEEVVELIMTRIHQGSRKTLMIATHRPDEAMQLCNKIMVVHGGRVKGLDLIADLTTNSSGLLQYYRQRLNSVEELCGS